MLGIINSPLMVEKLERLECQEPCFLLLWFKFFPLGARRGNSYVKCNRKTLKSLIPFAPCVFGSSTKSMENITYCFHDKKADYFRIPSSWNSPNGNGRPLLGFEASSDMLFTWNWTEQLTNQSFTCISSPQDSGWSSYRSGKKTMITSPQTFMPQ